MRQERSRTVLLLAVAALLLAASVSQAQFMRGGGFRVPSFGFFPGYTPYMGNNWPWLPSYSYSWNPYTYANPWAGDASPYGYSVGPSYYSGNSFGVPANGGAGYAYGNLSGPPAKSNYSRLEEITPGNAGRRAPNRTRPGNHSRIDEIDTGTRPPPR
jgi:hypothetical protein